MADHISSDVYILSARDLDARTQAAFQRGVERGRLEERIAIGKEQVAFNCANWKDGRCESCGVQWQGMDAVRRAAGAVYGLRNLRDGALRGVRRRLVRRRQPKRARQPCYDMRHHCQPSHWYDRLGT